MICYGSRVIMLQSRLSGLYFKDFGLWVTQGAEALDFATLEKARQFIRTQHVNDVVVRETTETETLLIRPTRPATNQRSRVAPRFAS